MFAPTGFGVIVSAATGGPFTTIGTLTTLLPAGLPTVRVTAPRRRARGDGLCRRGAPAEGAARERPLPAGRLARGGVGELDGAAGEDRVGEARGRRVVHVEGRLRVGRRGGRRIVVGGVDDRGVVARLRERLQRALQRRRADDGGRGIQERPRPVRARAAGQPGRQRAGLGGRDDRRRRRRGRAAGHRQRGRHDRRSRAGGQPPTSNACAGPSRDRCHPSRLPLNCVGPSGDYNARARPGIRAAGQKARFGNSVTRSRRASKAARTAADPPVSSAPRRSSRPAPSPSATSSERCIRSSCGLSCAQQRDEP